ncbi:MAG: hypothetical protein NTX53_02910 [candidate division WOR-3 bacterium]|nr:hypothetical protein [candidate division WOR-3 bacterium]
MMHVGFTLVSKYQPDQRPVTSLRELMIKVAVGIQPGSLPLGVLYRGTVRCAVVHYSIGLALELGATLRSAPGRENATPYAALLVQLPTIVFPFGSNLRTLGSDF